MYTISRDPCRTKFGWVPVPNQKVMNPTTTCASFVIVCKKWWVSNTNDESSAHLDELQFLEKFTTSTRWSRWGSTVYLLSHMFLAHLTQRVMKGHVSYCHHWASVVRPSVNFSHFNQLLWNHWANLNQTLVEWSLDGPLPKLCPVIPTSNQDGHQAKNRKKGGWNFNCSLLL
jgi:hypothetical protein